MTGPLSVQAADKLGYKPIAANVRQPRTCAQFRLFSSVSVVITETLPNPATVLTKVVNFASDHDMASLMYKRQALIRGEMDL